MKLKPTVISTFAGGGGSSLGYKWAGFRELLAIDFDKNSVETLKKNFDFPVWQRDINDVTAEEVLDFCGMKKGELDVLDGSPPCQGFSTAGKRNLNDSRNDLFKAFIKLIRGLSPRFFVMENVSGMAKGQYRGKFNEILSSLKRTGYSVRCRLMNAKHYGVPQSRQRIVFIGARKNLNVVPDFPNPCKKTMTVRDAIWDLKDTKFEANSNEFMMKLMKKVQPGRSAADIMNGKYFDAIRLSWGKPSPTVKRSFRKGMNAFYHPSQDRNLSILELKRVCSFPDDYVLTGKFEEQWARLGNAVMPKFMYHIARTIRKQLSGLKGRKR